jgi:uncharacterized Zn finger protein
MLGYRDHGKFMPDARERTGPVTNDSQPQQSHDFAVEVSAEMSEAICDCAWVNMWCKKGGR